MSDNWELIKMKMSETGTTCLLVSENGRSRFNRIA